MDVTVAICTWNRSQLLDQTLAKMSSLKVPAGLEWELLVVNNNCTDDTDVVIAKYQDALPLHRLFERRAGHSNARNCAVRAAQGELILWTDDDVLVDEYWLTALVDASARHPLALGFGGPIEPWFPVPPDPDYLHAFPMMRSGFCGVDHGLPEMVLPADRLIHGANMAFRRHVHVENPFDSSLGMKPKAIAPGRFSDTLAIGGGEETDLLLKIRDSGGQIVWVPTMRVEHYVDPRRTTDNYLRSLIMDRARQSVRWQGIPSGTRVLGVPRWLLREWLEVTVAHWYNRLTTNRRTALQKKNRRWQLSGMIAGCLAESYRARWSKTPQRERGTCSEVSGLLGR